MMREIYYLSIFIIITGFAIYDIYKKRVPNKALVSFLPAAFAAPVINKLAANPGLTGWSSFIRPFLYALSGSAAGFIILLSAALISKNGNGIGGGDIKLTAVLGFIYGTAGIIHILMIASFLATLAGIYIKRKSGGQTLRLPFVPFMAIGVLLVTVVRFL